MMRPNLPSLLVGFLAIVVVLQGVVIFHLSRSTTKMTKKVEKPSTANGNSKTEQKVLPVLAQQQTCPKDGLEASVLIIAAVPADAKHLTAMWTLVECLSVGVDTVLISAPHEAKGLVDQVVDKMRDNQLHPSIHSFTTKNDRYDVGLWCDALEYLPLGCYRYYMLVNDSVYALRKYRTILDTLQASNQYQMVGLTFSYLGGSYWVESFLRGFDRRGIDIFRQHACMADASDPTFATKRGIVDHYEIGLAAQFPNTLQVVKGLYSAEPPEGYTFGNSSLTWLFAANSRYWREILVNRFYFPLGKVKNPRHFPNVSSPNLNLCTQHVNEDRTYFSRFFE